MPVTIYPASEIKGVLFMPGDKSISHRLAMLGACAQGVSTFHHFLLSSDTASTLEALRACGVQIFQKGTEVSVVSYGLKNFASEVFLNCGNSGTTARLLMGLLAGVPGKFHFDGDESLRKRPMERVTFPLRQMGASFSSSSLPLTMNGTSFLKAIRYHSPVASAQVKSAVLLAALSAEGETVFTEPYLSRDHTERLFPLFGLELKKQDQALCVRGKQQAQPATFTVPGDISSASFFVALALLSPKGEIAFQDVGLNPTRLGFLKACKRMGGNLRWEVTGQEIEPRGFIQACSSSLSGIALLPEEVPALIDELPLIALLGTQAQGETSVSGAKELRVKESDRIHQVVQGFQKMGVEIEEKEDGFVISGPQKLRGAHFPSFHDHRLTMMFAVAASLASTPSFFEDEQDVNISFPSFFSLLRECGVHVEA